MRLLQTLLALPIPAWSAHAGVLLIWQAQARCTLRVSEKRAEHRSQRVRSQLFSTFHLTILV